MARQPICARHSPVEFQLRSVRSARQPRSRANLRYSSSRWPDRRRSTAAATQHWADTTLPATSLTYRDNALGCWFAAPALAPAADDCQGCCDNQTCNKHVTLGELGRHLSWFRLAPCRTALAMTTTESPAQHRPAADPSSVSHSASYQPLPCPHHGPPNLGSAEPARSKERWRVLPSAVDAVMGDTERQRASPS